jgi:arsenite-transporting ATPase
MSKTADFFARATRILFFSGKGGVGKTSLACATALKLAHRGRKVLLVSTDPASNLDEVLGVTLSAQPTPVPDAEGLLALNIDPEAAARAYRENVVGPYRGVLPEAAVASMEEQLSGGCTLEIAAFDQFTSLLGDPERTRPYGHIVFDTAPTGHTLRLLKLPAAWTGFMAENTTGTSCLGPLAGLQAQRKLYEASLAALMDPTLTTLVLVTRPEQSALAEADRMRAELAALGMKNQFLFVNGYLPPHSESDDPAIHALQARQFQALEQMPATLTALPRINVPLLPFAPMGVENLGRIFAPNVDPPAIPEPAPNTRLEPFEPLVSLIDEIESAGRGVVLTMGKGGVGKTTIAAAIAMELARRGHKVHLSTTDPAAHVAETVGNGMDNLQVSRIDPAAEVRRYTEAVLAKSAPNLDQQGMALLEEDLRSPCTEEIAVFSAFAETVERGESGFVVLDTAPTGHTLLLLDAAEAYHREVLRTQSEMPESVRKLLPRLRDPDFSRILLVAIPEATPVHEAGKLQEDLLRAGIEPFAWVMNQCFAGGDFRDPLLIQKGSRELPFLEEVHQSYARRVALTPWQPEPPVGPERLRNLISPSSAAKEARLVM